VIPFYSLMIATEPIDQDTFDEIGLRNGESFGDLRHLVIYGQRTLDNRLAFGGEARRTTTDRPSNRVRPQSKDSRADSRHARRSVPRA